MMVLQNAIASVLVRAGASGSERSTKSYRTCNNPLLIR
jgi:hypothetical protein